jgi:hypothetical protein
MPREGIHEMFGTRERYLGLIAQLWARVLTAARERERGDVAGWDTWLESGREYAPAPRPS